VLLGQFMLVINWRHQLFLHTSVLKVKQRKNEFLCCSGVAAGRPIKNQSEAMLPRRVLVGRL
jgi:hypothetical protein